MKKQIDIPEQEQQIGKSVITSSGMTDIHKPFGSYHHGHLREALISAAVARLAVTSSTDISIRSLAADAGTSHVAAYRHFASRRHLLAAVGEEGFRRFNAHMPKADDPRVAGLSPVEALACGSAEYVRFAIANPGHFRAMFHKELPPREDFPEYCTQAQGAYQCLMAAVAPVLGENPEVTAICDAATAVWSIVHGFSVLELEGQFDEPEKSFVVDAPAMATSAVRAWATGFQLQRSSVNR